MCFKSLFLLLISSIVSGVSVNAQSFTEYDTTFTNTYYTQKVSQFEQLNIKANSIVFLGDSITDMAEWAELLPKHSVINRGISSDITFGLLARLDLIIKAQPSHLFILIGINDLARNIPPKIIDRNVREMIVQIKSLSPSTKIYIQSILPTNPAYPQFKGHQNKEEAILETNKLLMKTALQENVEFVDLHSGFVNEQGYLKKEFTHDGLHLSGAGYMNWVKILRSKKYL